jgi:uncharacterized protein (TIGR02271 family)
MIDSTNINAITGSTVFDTDGDKIGKIGQVYVDQNTGAPIWASIHTGLFGTSESFVPLTGASFDGEHVSVPYLKGFVKDAPRVDSGQSLDEGQTSDLYRYYAGNGAASEPASEAGDENQPVFDQDDYPATATEERTDAGSPKSTNTAEETAPAGSSEATMTRSEEQLHVGTEQVEAGRARLHKYVTSEQESVTIPVRHEEVHVEREPITDGAPVDNDALGEEEHELILHAEQPVVSKDTVPVERVSLGTETITEQQTITDDVRKEHVTLDDTTHDEATGDTTPGN